MQIPSRPDVIVVADSLNENVAIMKLDLTVVDRGT